jgi:hypothetical protein
MWIGDAVDLARVCQWHIIVLGKRSSRPMTYLKAASALFTDSERADIVTAIALDPEAGDLMPGSGGYRKRRFGRTGIGKRGGARVVYLYGGEDFPIFLITAYAKAEKGNLSKAEQNALAKMAKSFFEDYRRKA